MSEISLNNITSGYNLSKINANFNIIQQNINGNVLHTSGGQNTMYQQLDMNNYEIINVYTNVNDPGSLLTVGAADARYYIVHKVPSPVYDGDAVNKKWAQQQYLSLELYAESLVAGVVGGYGFFKQSGDGAVGRTFQDKMREIDSPYDYGAVGDGVTDDSAAIQRWFNYIQNLPGGKYSIGKGGDFLLNSQVSLNSTAATSNYRDKVIDFGGSRFLHNFGSVNVVYDATSLSTAFNSWSLVGPVSLSTEGYITFSVDTSTTTVGKASITLNGLTVGKTYAVTAEFTKYVEGNGGTFGMYVNNVRIARSQYGVGDIRGEFVATSTSETLMIQNDNGPDTQAAASIYKVDVRESSYALLLYQSGTAAQLGSLHLYDLRIDANTTKALGGLRTNDINNVKLINPTFYNFTNGDGYYQCNNISWSENVSVYNASYVSCKFGRRWGRTISGGNTNSFSRTADYNCFHSGCEYVFYAEPSCAVYDAVIDEIHGNVSSATKAIIHTSGDWTSSTVSGFKHEVNGKHAMGFGIQEIGTISNRSPSIGVVGASAGVAGSGTVGLIRTYSAKSPLVWAPSIGSPVDMTKTHSLKSWDQWRISSESSSGVLSQDWVELQTALSPNVAYTFDNNGSCSYEHGVVQVEAVLRTSTGGSMQGSKICVIMAKGGAADADSSVNKTTLATITVSGISLSVTWPGNSPPCVTYSGTTGSYSLLVRVKAL